MCAAGARVTGLRHGSGAGRSFESTSVTGPLATAWRRFRSAAEESRPAAATEEFKNAFARGYLLSSGPRKTEVPAHWATVVVGPWRLDHDPRLPVAIASRDVDPQAVLVLGHAFCSEWGTTDSAATSRRLLEAVAAKSEWTKFDREVAWLGGRYVVVAFDGEETRVHVDPMASLSCFYAEGPSRALHLSSHSALVARAVGEESSTQTQWIMRHPDYNSPGGKSLPGLIQPHDRVSLVFANCALAIDDRSVRHLRVFPYADLGAMSVAHAASTFIDELRFQMRCWLDVASSHYLALTAGSDSRAILASTMDQLQARDVTALTYHFFERGTSSTTVDLVGASRLARDARLRFIAVDLSKQLQGTSPMAGLYNETFPTWARFPTLAQALYETLPADSTLTVGIGGEIGTVFYQERSETNITPQVLARKFTQAGVSGSAELIKHMEAYSEHTHLRSDAIANYDFYDLFYWEHRLSKWAAAGYSEFDLSTSTVLPLNSRRLLCAMLALPLEQRRSKAIYGQIETWWQPHRDNGE